MRRSLTSSPPWRGTAAALVGVAAVVALAYLVAVPTAALVVTVVSLAAGNGYSKAYSP